MLCTPIPPYVQNVSPWDIMCITFTNKAANEIDSRLSKLMTNGENKFLTVSVLEMDGIVVLFPVPSRAPLVVLSKSAISF